VSKKRPYLYDITKDKNCFILVYYITIYSKKEVYRTRKNPMDTQLISTLPSILLLLACDGTSPENNASNTPAMPSGIYTDLASAPVGALVTVYGIDSESASWPVTMHGKGKTVVRVPASPPPLRINELDIPVSIHEGRILEATPETLTQTFRALQSGDVLYLHEGTYSGHYDDNGWNESNFVFFSGGTPQQPVALLAWPGENVVIDNTATERPNFYLGDSGGGRNGSYLTLAGMQLRAKEATIYGGGNTADSNTPESGAAYVRIVGCTHTITDATSNTMTGIIAAQGDGWKILGNTLYDAAERTVINNNHAIYIQNGADDVEIAYNRLSDLRMGHTIQLHQDGTPLLYENIDIHDNIIQNAAPDDARGISISNVDIASTVRIHDNNITNVGQGFGGVTVYRGAVDIEGNSFLHVNGPGIQANGNYGGNRTITESGNSFNDVAEGAYGAENGASLSDFIHE